jgi:multicomponent K+:H+ antiporter subunit D
MLGLARAGSVLFWKTEGAARAAPAMVPVMAIGVALAALVAQTVFAGPLMEWLTIAADALHDPATSIAVMRLGVTP